MSILMKAKKWRNKKTNHAIKIFGKESMDYDI